MNRQVQAYERLSKLLAALEDDILKMPDEEAVKALDVGRHGVDDVTRLIGAQLAKHRVDSAAPTRQTLPKARLRRPAAAKVEAQVALLGRLLAARPDLSAQLQAVLSGGRTPNAREVEKIIAELVRKGALPKDE